MFDTASIPPRTSMNMLVAFYNLTRFARWSSKAAPEQVYSLMDRLAEMAGEKVGSAEGTIVKFIGDAALIVFPEEIAGAGVRCLKELKSMADTWLADNGLESRMNIKAHFGPVVCGPFGTKDGKRFDVFGDTVNTTFRLISYGFTISPQAFRCLDEAGRKLFKKHTPPIRYIPVEESHRD